MQTPPAYLRDHEPEFRRDPRAAARSWFAEARYGLFLHFGLYSLIGRHEWLQRNECIRPGEYAHLAQSFRAEGFDAEAIADLACAGGMRYVNLTTRHHDGFCLWATAETSFNSVEAAPCGRDLVGELAEACHKRGLGLCLYYSHGRDWKHPHAPNNEHFGGGARPPYDPPEPTYAAGEGHDLEHYLAFMEAQITELLTNYGPIAAIWLDGIGVPRNPTSDRYRTADFRTQELYEHIWSLQPQVLVSYKQGLTGTEDFFAPEEHWSFDPATASKPWEICACMTKGGCWGYTAGKPHRDADELEQLYRDVRGKGGNLLINTGPLPDGSIHPGDEAAIREVGERLRG